MSDLDAAKKAFNKAIDNADFARIGRTFGDKGYHYGLLKQDRPNMPEAQVKRVSDMLDAGFSWVSETDSVVGLSNEFGGEITYFDVDREGNATKNLLNEQTIKITKEKRHEENNDGF